MFNVIGIVTKPKDTKSQDIARKLSHFLKQQGVVVTNNNTEISKHADLIIAIGGDGTLLYSARFFVDNNIPILGINLGRLGFLIDVPVNTMFEVMEEVLAGEFTKEERSLLKCFIVEDEHILGECLAFNDMVVHRTEILEMIEFDLFVDTKFVNTQRADGFIIATPTGSTAYALSSGGPIVHPNINAISLVSICPNTINHRPLLVPTDSEITINIKASSKGVVSFDGQTPIKIISGQSIKVQQHTNNIYLLHPQNYDYFSIIRSKLHWSIK